MSIDLESRCLGSLLGLASGDAVGTAVEFSPRGSFAPLTDMVGGGPFSLAPGKWTDDTSMALCLAESLLARSGFDAADQMSRYLNWWKWGYWSSTGSCFDIGNTVAGALRRFEATGEPFAGSTDPWTAGNGSLMRLAPVVLYYFPDLDQVLHYAAESSRTTHGASEAVDACRLFAAMLYEALAGTPKAALLASPPYRPQEPKVREIAGRAYVAKSETAIVGSGYAVAALEAALWCFHHTETFEAAVLKAANLGDDADTTAALVGQVAGAFYGVEAIPGHWLARLSHRKEIEDLARRLWRRRVDARLSSEV